ncbi:MAG: tripartite tricarboxylate transporter TctB family protein [Clostridiales bacterium]|nr:tripartite tricarboxylate transporter TctB family protein [Clostridiales bacterium]
MKKIANIIACVFIAVAVVFFIVSLSFPPGSNGAVGPGYFPRIMCVLVIALSVLELILSRKEKIPEELQEVKIFKKENLRVWVTMGITLAYIICIKEIGFIVSSVVFQYGMNYYFKVHEKNKILSAVLPIIVVAVLYFIFHNLLHVNLPKGLLF